MEPERSGNEGKKPSKSIQSRSGEDKTPKKSRTDLDEKKDKGRKRTLVPSSSSHEISCKRLKLAFVDDKSPDKRQENKTKSSSSEKVKTPVKDKSKATVTSTKILKKSPKGKQMTSPVYPPTPVLSGTPKKVCTPSKKNPPSSPSTSATTPSPKRRLVSNI